MTASRLLARCVAAALALAALAQVPGATRAEDEPPPPAFCWRFGVPVTDVAAGPDGTTIVAGFSTDPAIPGATELPPLLDDVTWDRAGWYFVTVLDRSGAPVRTTCIAGSQPVAPIAGLIDLSVAPDGAVWMVGRSRLREVNPLPMDPEARTYPIEAWIARVDAAGEVAFATRVAEAQFTAVAALADGDAVVAGSVSRRSFPRDFDGLESDGVAVRVRADGSGHAWIRTVGYVDSGVGVAVAPDGYGCFVAAASFRSRWNRTVPGPRPAAELRRELRRSERRLVTIAEFHGGAEAARASTGLVLPTFASLGAARRRAVCAARDGAVAVGGAGSIAVLAPGMDRVEAARIIAPIDAPWNDRVVRRISELPDGSFLLAHDGGQRTRMGTIVDRGLRHPRRLPPAFGFLAADLTCAPDGTTIAAGPGDGLASNAPAVSASEGGHWVARCDLAAHAGPEDLAVRHAGADGAALAWTSFVAEIREWTIERSSSGSDPHVVVARLGGDARSHAEYGLAPATRYEYRVVANFADGMRLADVIDHVSRPAPLATAEVETLPSGLRISIDAGANGPEAEFEVEGRTPGGAWRALSSSPFRAPEAFLDAELAASVAELRVRATAGGCESPWLHVRP